MTSHAERHHRDQLATRLVSRWFNTNPTQLITWHIDGDHAIATIRVPLTPEELNEYREIVQP